MVDERGFLVLTGSLSDFGEASVSLPLDASIDDVGHDLSLDLFEQCSRAVRVHFLHVEAMLSKRVSRSLR